MVIDWHAGSTEGVNMEEPGRTNETRALLLIGIVILAVIFIGGMVTEPGAHFLETEIFGTDSR